MSEVRISVVNGRTDKEEHDVPFSVYEDEGFGILHFHDHDEWCDTEVTLGILVANIGEE